MMDKNTPQLYYTPMSAPCRSVLMVAAALRLKLNLKPINLMEQEHLRPTFLRISPHHVVPTLVDNEFSMFESRAICIYLVEKYGKNDALYPRNPKTRATINQLIYFDMGTLFKRFYEYFIPMFHGEQPKEENLAALKEAMGFLDYFLTDKKFAVNYRLTIADLILLASVSTIETAGFDFSPYEHVRNWFANMKEVAPGYDTNLEGLALIKGMMDKMKAAQAVETRNEEISVQAAKAEEPTRPEKLVQFEKIKFQISDDGKVMLSPGVVAEVMSFSAATPAATEEITAIPEIEPQQIAVPLIEVEVNGTPEIEPQQIAVPLIEVEAGAIPKIEPQQIAVPLIEVEVNAIPEFEPQQIAVPLIEVEVTPVKSIEITAIPEVEPQAIAVPLIEIIPEATAVSASSAISINSTSEVITTGGTKTTVTSSSEVFHENSSSEVTQEVVTVVKEVITTTEFTKVIQSESVNGVEVQTVEIVENGRH